MTQAALEWILSRQTYGELITGTEVKAQETFTGGGGSELALSTVDSSS